MKILHIDGREVIKKKGEFSKYDLIIIDGVLSPSIWENRELYISITSESPGLGALKTIDEYLINNKKLIPDTYESKKFGKIGFSYEIQCDMDRTYNERRYVIHIENCFFGRMYLNQLLARPLTKKEDISPLIGIVGGKRIVKPIIKHLENSDLKKAKTYYEYKLTDEEKELIEKLDKPNKIGINEEEYRTYLTMFLIADELGWMGITDLQEVRKKLVEDFKKNL